MNPTDPGWIASPWAYWPIAVLLAGVGFALLWFALLRDRSRGRPRCPKCWYDMTGAVTDPAGERDAATVPLTCPECGHDARTRKRLFKTRRRPGWAALALLLLTASWYSYHVRDRMIAFSESWKTAAIPTTALAAAIPWLDQPGFDLAYTRYGRHGSESNLWLWQDWLLARGCIIVFQDTNRTETTRRFAGYWLGDLGRRVDAPIDPLIDALDDPVADVRQTAAYALAAAGPRAAPAVPKLIERLDDRESGVCSGALEALGRIGPVQFRHMDDQRLADVLAAIVRHDGAAADTTAHARDAYLHEMIRRGTPELTDRLRDIISTAPVSRLFEDARVDLELTTALRRIEGGPDPLRIELLEQTELNCTAPTLPKVKVRIINVDVARAPVGFQRGGDYRGERPLRWRFEVRDAAGRAWPVRPHNFSAGGMFSFGPLAHGESFDIELDMNAYIDPPPPGKYTLVIQYHNSIYLSDEQDVSELIVSTSRAIPLRVEAAE